MRRDFEDKRDAKIAEFRALEANRKAVEDATGITEATAKAKALDAEQLSIMHELIAANPKTLAEAAAKAKHLHGVLDSESVEITQALLLSVIRSLI